MAVRTQRSRTTGRRTYAVQMANGDTVTTSAAGLGFNTSGEATLHSQNDTLVLTTSASGLATTRIATTSDLVFNGTDPSAASVGRKLVKTITGIADATATDVATVTVPNTGNAAYVKITFVASLGAGGSVGAFEANRSGEYLATISRVAGVAAVVVLSSVAEASTAAVAGATTCAATVTATAMTGAVGATNTFTFQTTITKGAGSSAAHQGIYTFEIMNAVASGITIA